MQQLNGVRCLVTGGAGYVGSHVVRALVDRGAEVFVIDNFYSGHGWAVPAGHVCNADIGDVNKMTEVFDANEFDAVLHLAAHIWVGESIAAPEKYYTNNVVNSVRLFELAARRGVKVVVFSSTAAVYGRPTTIPVPEEAPKTPISPYGASKLMGERVLQDMARAHGQSAAILRYFNVVGAHEDGTLGEATRDSTHLFKVACEASLGLRSRLHIHGDDHPTPDGTCVRDYVHVQDIADAHAAALAHLLQQPGELVLNCGLGHGFSVREVVDAFHRVTGIDLDPAIGPRKPGDPPMLVADASRIERVLGWRPRRTDLDVMVGSAWAWEQRYQRYLQGKAARP